jgi:hypothetical protein
MWLMLHLGVDISSSESSEGIIGSGYENSLVLSWLLVKLLGEELRTVSSPISSGCILVILPVARQMIFVSKHCQTTQCCYY